MKQIFHSHVVTTVSRADAGNLLAQTLLLNSRYEAVAKIFAAEDSFIISKACWEIFRSPGGQLNDARTVAELTGQEAYLSIGPCLRTVGQKDGELPRELLADCVKGMIQAETYLFAERGFASPKDYDNFWRENYRDSCRRFSIADGRTQSWFAFIAERRPGTDCLFNRCKTVAIHAMPDGTVTASGHFIDSFHELSIAMTTSDGIITACSADLIRVPHVVCRETAAHLSALTGKAVGDITSKAAAACAGGPMGCNHLADLTYHTAKSLQQSSTE